MVRTQFVARALTMLTVTLALEATAGAQTPARSFAELQPRLTVGQRVKVIEGHGSSRRITKGKVVAITAVQLEIRQRPAFYSRERRRVFTEQTVSRIESAHIIWKGAAIGVGVGVVTMLALQRHTDRLHPEEAGMLSGIIPGSGAAIGERIEEKRQRRLLYLAPPHRTTP